MKEINKLKILYARKSKHSSYQLLPKRLSLIIGNDKFVIKTRHEEERFRYILKNVDVKGKKILDIGGNTGFFSFELIDKGAQNIHYYEGNKIHADFVCLAAKILRIKSKIKITNNYLTFKDELENKKYDIILLLNVLHHLGDDYGNKKTSIKRTQQDIIKQLNYLAKNTSILVFQMGFNWKGNIKKLLFEKGTKKEVVDFINQGIKNYWEVIKIGVAEIINDKIEYFDLNDKNIIRNDQLGEFLNRPIFILKSLKKYEK